MSESNEIPVKPEFLLEYVHMKVKYKCANPSKFYADEPYGYVEKKEFTRALASIDYQFDDDFPEDDGIARGELYRDCKKYFEEANKMKKEKSAKNSNKNKSKKNRKQAKKFKNKGVRKLFRVTKIDMSFLNIKTMKHVKNSLVSSELVESDQDNFQDDDLQDLAQDFTKEVYGTRNNNITLDYVRDERQANDRAKIILEYKEEP